MITITTLDGLTHYLDSPEAIADIASPNTREALQAAWDAGHWESYTPPEPEPEPPEPNWKDFRISLIVNAAFRAWGNQLPADWREDLKGAALAANPEALQSVYDHLASLYPPTPEGAAEWQQIATDAHIPVTFKWPPA